MKKILFFGILLGVFFATDFAVASIVDLPSETCSGGCDKACRCVIEKDDSKITKYFYKRQDTVYATCNQRLDSVMNNILHVDLAKSNYSCYTETFCDDYSVKCETVETKDYCCCRDSAPGVLGTDRKCKVTLGVPADGLHCNSSIFSGVFGGDQGDIAYDAKEAGYIGYVVDSEGGCGSYEKNTMAGYVAKSDITTDTLKEEAANVLNPMNFKTGTAGVQQLMSKVVNALTFAMGSLLLLFYVYAGILWMTAAGNTERVGQAKKIVVWSTLGVVVMLASYMIIKTVFQTIG